MIRAVTCGAQSTECAFKRRRFAEDDLEHLFSVRRSVNTDRSIPGRQHFIRIRIT